MKHEVMYKEINSCFCVKLYLIWLNKYFSVWFKRKRNLWCLNYNDMIPLIIYIFASNKPVLQLVSKQNKTMLMWSYFVEFDKNQKSICCFYVTGREGGLSHHAAGVGRCCNKTRIRTQRVALIRKLCGTYVAK